MSVSGNWKLDKIDLNSVFQEKWIYYKLAQHASFSADLATLG